MKTKDTRKRITVSDELHRLLKVEAAKERVTIEMFIKNLVLTLWKT